MLTNNKLVFKSTSTTPLSIFKDIESKVISQNNKIRKGAIVEALRTREKQISTALQDGVAIPHGEIEGLKKPMVVVVKTNANVKWKTLDNSKVRIAIAILVPVDSSKMHFDILTKLSKKLIDKDFIKQIKTGSIVKTVELINGLAKIKKNQKSETNPLKQGRYDVVGVTACVTGIAHTYMSAETIEKEADALDLSYKIETQGRTTQNQLTVEEIKGAKYVIIAADIDIDMSRFAGVKVFRTTTKGAIKNPNALFDLDKSILVKSKVKAISNKIIERSEKEITFDNFWGRAYKSLMTGVSHMLPFVVFGGIMIAMSFLIDVANAGAPNYGSANPVAEWFNEMGGIGMRLMIPILAAYISFNMIGKQGLLPGFIIGMIAAGSGPAWIEIFGAAAPTWAGEAGSQIASSGFIGAIAGALLGVAIYIGVMITIDKVISDKLRGIKQILLYPLFGTFFAAGIFWFVNIPLTYLFWGLFAGLEGMRSINALWLLGLVLGGMMAIDMGGPINKTAYIFGTVMLGTTTYSVEMAAVMAGGMVPPLAIAMATMFGRKKLWDESDISGGYNNWVMGASFITEGAIPFAAKHPKAIMPSIITGSALAGALVAAFQIGLAAPHGGIFTMALVRSDLFSNASIGVEMFVAILLYLGSIFVGSALAAAMIVFLRNKQVNAEVQ